MTDIQKLIEQARSGDHRVTRPGLVLELADALEAEHQRAEMLANTGSCWDRAPRAWVPEGQCAPEPPFCELRAGHRGAHQSGRTQWMHLSPYSSVKAERDRRRFEKAHTPTAPRFVTEEGLRTWVAAPTDDEREATSEEVEAMRRVIARGSYSMTLEDLPYQDVAERLAQAGFGFRRPVSPEPSAKGEVDETDASYQPCHFDTSGMYARTWCHTHGQDHVMPDGDVWVNGFDLGDGHTYSGPISPDDLIAARPEPQGEPSDPPQRLVHEVNMMLNSVASHGPAALTDTSDRMYMPGLLRRLRDAIYPKPAQRLAAGNAVRAEMARNGFDVHRMVYGQEIANVLAGAALDAALRAVTEQGENRSSAP